MRFYDGKDDRVVLPTGRTVTVVSSGQISCKKGDHMTIRKNGREDWSLFYCESGCMYFENSILKSGQLWIYPPGVAQKYTVYKKDGTVYRYLHFTGYDITKLFNELNISHSVVVDVNNIVSDCLKSICGCIDNDGALYTIMAEYHALYLFSCLAKKSENIQKNTLMKRVTDDMAHSFVQQYDAEKYAKMLNMSVSRFNHLFTQHVGVSPYSYCINLRIANACSLLEQTELKIVKISTLCGYSDPMYFTQAFKKVTGKTPTAYRKINRLKK